MKSIIFSLSLLAVSSLQGFSQEWKLAWADEFQYQGVPEQSKWDYEEGKVRNNESQYYTRVRSENARVEDGMLIIEAKAEDYTSYTSASIQSSL